VPEAAPGLWAAAIGAPGYHANAQSRGVLMQMQTCQVCQKQNPLGAEYCEDCGAALGGATAAPASPRVGAEAVPQASDPSGGTHELGLDAAPLAPPPAGAATPPPAADGAAPPAPTAGGQKPRLAVKRFGALTGEQIPLMGERVVVGRFDPETGPVDLDLSSSPEAQHVSRHHGELYREADGRWFIRDLGSTNGVFVKGANDSSFGQRITAPRAIASGDELAFGNARFVFQTD